MIDQLRQVIDHLQQLEGVTEDEQRALAQKIEALIEELVRQNIIEHQSHSHQVSTPL
jgi:hypothetical protein